ncbi:MAG: hypothetical protein J0H63_04755, partial [Rhizobiales bacterium]|nr:hypothetical protein [Hyphomicrobiales bacterium]
MSDFYSILKQSIVDRRLTKPGQREEVYGQARAAMIRKLWSFDPPLAEDEIDTRIGTFDRAVERIARDLVALFAAPPSRSLPPRPPRAQPPPGEAYDEADMAPATAPVPARRLPPVPTRAPAPAPIRAARHDPLAER